MPKEVGARWGTREDTSHPNEMARPVWLVGRTRPTRLIHPGHAVNRPYTLLAMHFPLLPCRIRCTT